MTTTGSQRCSTPNGDWVQLYQREYGHLGPRAYPSTERKELLSIGAAYSAIPTPLTGIPHIELPGPKRRTILDESYRSITHERRQPSHRAHKTISRRRELAFDGQRRWLSLRMHSLPTPSGTHLALGCLSSPLMTSGIFATLVLDGARRYAPTLAGIPPGTLPPQQA